MSRKSLPAYGPEVPLTMRRKPDRRPKRVHYTTDLDRAVGFAGWAFQCADFTSDPHPSMTHAIKARDAALTWGKCGLRHDIIRLYYARSGGRRPASEQIPDGFPVPFDAPDDEPMVVLTDEQAADAWCTAVELLEQVDSADTAVASSCL
jgi:hypothetical protein